MNDIQPSLSYNKEETTCAACWSIRWSFGMVSSSDYNCFCLCSLLWFWINVSVKCQFLWNILLTYWAMAMKKSWSGYNGDLFTLDNINKEFMNKNHSKIFGLRVVDVVVLMIVMLNQVIIMQLLVQHNRLEWFSLFITYFTSSHKYNH